MKTTKVEVTIELVKTVTIEIEHHPSEDPCVLTQSETHHAIFAAGLACLSCAGARVVGVRKVES